MRKIIDALVLLTACVVAVALAAEIAEKCAADGIVRPHDWIGMALCAVLVVFIIAVSVEGDSYTNPLLRG